MSLRDSATKSFDGIIHTFIEIISTKYDLSEEELLNIWEGNTIKPVKKINKHVENTPSSSDTNNNRSKTELMKCSKNELVEMCKERGIKRSGSKAELATRLTGGEVVNSPVAKTPVAKKIVAKISKITVNRNQFGNYEHPETSLVFNSSLFVIGKQLDDGSVASLTEDDIDLCNQFKFKYELPENLNTEVLDDEVVDELDNELDDDSGADDIDEEDLLDDEDDDDDYEVEYEEEY